MENPDSSHMFFHIKRGRGELNNMPVRLMGGLSLIGCCAAGCVGLLWPILEIQSGKKVILFSPEAVGLTVATFLLGSMFLVFGSRAEAIFGADKKMLWGIFLIVLILVLAVSTSILFEAYLKSFGVTVVHLIPIPI